MATRRNPSTPSAKKTAAPPSAAPTQSGEGLLRAGLKALGNARDQAVKRQTHVIESLLGIKGSSAESTTPLAGGLGLIAPNFGLRKFEDVFDQRIAAALERLGVHSAAEVQALRDEVKQLRAELQALRAPTKKPAAKVAKNPAAPARKARAG